MEKPIIIVGAKTIARIAVDIFHSNDVLIYCLLDDDETLHKTEIQGISVLGSLTNDEFLKYIGKKCDVFVAIENIEERIETVEMIIEKRKTVPVNAIHAKAHISPFAHIEHGNLFSAGVIINPDAKIGNFNIFGTSSIVDFSARVGNYCNIGTNVVVNHGAVIEDEVLIGSGAIISPGVKIGKKAQIGPASLVVQDVPNGKTVFGVPAKQV
ncbi:MAG: acetyltransferase [Cytophagales bacterium]|nr:acetyltransferase [Cytophagales bacterium]MDW8385353.1 NeuD/PglB/VioB family sugar acetyltransferase [Flammeovirgaceae bacterium]